MDQLTVGKLFQIPAVELIVDTIFQLIIFLFIFTSSPKIGYYNYKQERDKEIIHLGSYKRKSKFCSALPVVNDDGATAVPVFTPTCTPPVLDVGGCTDSVSATIDYNATANLQELFSAK